MGYYVTSVTVIGRDDYHAYFAYYMPATRLKYEWVNEFFSKNFHLIANKIGPEGVIVASNEHTVDEYSAGLAKNLHDVALDVGRQGSFIHSGFPFLVVSRRPVGTIGLSHDEPNALAINLAAVAGESELASLVDGLIAAGRTVPRMSWT